MKLIITALNDKGKYAIDKHIVETKKIGLRIILKKYEIVNSLEFDPYRLIVEWKAKYFLWRLSLAKEKAIDKFNKVLKDSKEEFIKIMLSNGANINIDYNLEVIA